MAETTKLITGSESAVAAEALAWLAGQLRWERTLERLHQIAEGTAPVDGTTQAREQAA